MYAPSQIEYVKPALFESLPSPRKRLLGFQPHVLHQLHEAGLIRIIEVTRPGRKRPIELVHIPSLIAYIERVEELAKNDRLAKIRQGYARYHDNPFLPQPIDFKQPEQEVTP
jgi:hypothetical protein